MLLGNIMIYSSNEKYYLTALILSGIATIISSILLIPLYKEIGAVYVMIISMVTLITMLWYFYFKIENKIKT